MVPSRSRLHIPQRKKGEMGLKSMVRARTPAKRRARVDYKIFYYRQIPKNTPPIKVRSDLISTAKKRPISKITKTQTESPLKCGICSCRFFNLTRLFKHVCWRVNERFSCRKCWKMFSWRLDRRCHEQRCRKKCDKPRTYDLRFPKDREEEEGPEEAFEEQAVVKPQAEEKQNSEVLATSFRMNEKGHLVRSSRVQIAETKKSVAAAPFQPLDEQQESKPAGQLEEVTLTEAEEHCPGPFGLSFEEFFTNDVDMEYPISSDFLTEMTCYTADDTFTRMDPPTSHYTPPEESESWRSAELDNTRLRLELDEMRQRLGQLEQQMAQMQVVMSGKTEKAQPVPMKPVKKKRASAPRPLPFIQK